MAYPSNVWNQLKDKSPQDLIKALEKDGWKPDESRGAVQVYYRPKDKKRITIHLHPHKSYGRDTLTALLDAIGWSIGEMKRLKFIK